MAKQKLAVDCQIKSVTRTITDNKVTFKDLSFTDGQCRQLEDWLAEKRQVRVTIEPTEVLLTDEED